MVAVALALLVLALAIVALCVVIVHATGEIARGLDAAVRQATAMGRWLGRRSPGFPAAATEQDATRRVGLEELAESLLQEADRERDTVRPPGVTGSGRERVG